MKVFIQNLFNKEYRFLWLVVCASTIMVFLISYFQSIWLDEGLSIEFSRKSVAELLSISMRVDLHPPLYNLLLHYSGKFISQNVLWYRFWSGIAYAGSIIVLYKYLQSMVVEQKKRIVYASLFALSPFAIYYASEARSYMMVVLVSLIHFVAFDNICENRGRRKMQLILYSVVSIIGIYLFYPIAFLLVSNVVYVVLFKRDYFKKFIIPWVITTVAYVPWIGFVLLNRLGDSPTHFLNIPWWQIPAVIFIGFSGGRVAITDVNHVHWYWPTILISCIVAINFFGIYTLWRNKTQRQHIIRLLCTIGIPVILCLVVSFFKFSIFDPRYYAQVFPIFILLLIFSVHSLSETKPLLYRYTVPALFAVNLLFLGIYAFNPWFGREPWKKIVPILEARLEPRDAVVFIGSHQPPPTYVEYQTKSIEIISTDPITLTTEGERYIRIEEHLVQELQDNDRVWYSQFLEWQKDPEHIIRKMIEKDFEYKETIGFFKVQFDLYERKK
ncbi:MAG: hypothetical protein KBD29_01530 [Candidatus Magasanikbacteria bacterium]|nr:hypothetical protein [Candidatus Magasanikbacteria bacterium]